MRYAIAITLLLTALLLVWLFIPSDSGVSELAEYREPLEQSTGTAQRTPRTQSTEAIPFADETFTTDLSDTVDAEVSIPADFSLHGYLYTQDPNIDVYGLTLSLSMQFAPGLDAETDLKLQTVTDAEGRFSFKELLPGMYQVQLKAPGLAISQNSINAFMLQPDTETPEAALEVIAGASITGIVFNKDTLEPLSGEYIAALLQTSSRPGPLNIYLSERSNADGEYRIDHLPPGSFQMFHIDKKPQQLHSIPVEQFAYFTIVSEMQGFGFGRGRDTPAQPLLAEVKSGETTENVNIPVEVFPNTTVSGVVLMPDRTPAENVRVTLQSIEHMPVPHAHQYMTTDAKGEFYFENVEANHSYGVIASKDNAQIQDNIGMLTEAGIHGLELILQLRGSISGVVVTPDGEPYIGLPLWLSNTHFSIQVPIDSRNHAGSTQTGQDGTFQWSMLEPGEYYLYVYNQHGYPMYAFAELATIKIIENESQEGLRLVFRPPASSILGRVVNANREPVVDAQLIARTQSTEGERQIWASSSEQGNFILLAEEGYSYYITCSKSPFAVVERDQVYAGTKNLEIVMDEGLTLRGQVLNARTNEPVTNYMLLAMSLHNPRTPAELHDGRMSGTYYTEHNYRSQTPIIQPNTWGQYPEGRFEIQGVSRNVMLQITNTEGFYDYREVFENLTPASAAQEIVIRLKEAPYLEGKVIDRDRRPIANAAVTFGDPDRAYPIPMGGGMGPMNRSGMTFTDSEGFFRLQMLNEHGTLGLIASHPDFIPAGIPIPASAQAQRNLQIVLEAGGSIEGRITKGGRPVADAIVMYQPLPDMMGSPGMPFQHIEPSRTDLTGYYTINKLPTSSGNVMITDSVPGDSTAGTNFQQPGMRRHPHMVEVEVVAGYVTRLDYDIPIEDAAIYGTIRMADGTVPFQADIQIHITADEDSPSRYYATHMQPDGSYEMTELPSGTVQLTVSARVEAPVSHGSLQQDARQFQRPSAQESDNFDLARGTRVRRDFVLSQGNEIQFIMPRNQTEGVLWEVLLFEGQISQEDISNFLSSHGSGNLQPAGFASSYEGHMAYNLKPGTYTAVVLEIDMQAAQASEFMLIPPIRSVSQFTIRDNQHTGAFEIPLRF